MATDLQRIRQKARKDRSEVFTALWHHVCDVDHLRACYGTLDGTKKPLGLMAWTSYYAITDNSKRCGDYVYHATRILFKWLNRKSQRNSYRWEGYLQVLNWLKWPTARVRQDLNPFRREEAL